MKASNNVAKVFLASCMMLLLASGAALAQGKGPPFTPPGPPPIPPGLSDRALPPGRPFDGCGFQPPGQTRKAGGPPPGPRCALAAGDASGNVNAAAIAAAAQRVGVSLRAGLLTTPGGSLPQAVQARIHDLLTRPGQGNAASVRASLVSRGNGGARTEASTLVASAEGLLQYPTLLRESVLAHNAFVNASSTEFLADPPTEFLTIQAVLSALVDEAQGEGSPSASGGR